MTDYLVLQKQQNICYKEYDQTQSVESNSHYVKSVRIQTFSERISQVFIPNAGKYGQEKLRIRTLFTQLQWANTLNKNRKVAGSEPSGCSTMMTFR